MTGFVARTTIRAVQRRQFSLVNSMRRAARTFEPHPYQRMTVTEPAPPNYGKMVKERLVTAVVFVPAISIFLGWPLAARNVLNGHV